jgi:hypothetical protein
LFHNKDLGCFHRDLGCFKKNCFPLLINSHNGMSSKSVDKIFFL